jgi:hypothetical protein
MAIIPITPNSSGDSKRANIKPTKNVIPEFTTLSVKLHLKPEIVFFLIDVIQKLLFCIAVRNGI